MFADQLTQAIEQARTLTRLDHLSRTIWQGMASLAITEGDAERLAEQLHAKRSIVRGDIKPVGIPAGRLTIFPPRRVQRPRLRPLAIARRRHLAASGALPPASAARFTVGELAALWIVADEVRKNGHCDRTLAEIAARAGVSRTTAQNAMRAAAAAGLVTVQERRRQGQKNLPNIVRVVSREWLLWIKRGERIAARSSSSSTGFKKFDPTDRKDRKKEERGYLRVASKHDWNTSQAARTEKRHSALPGAG
jgi:DNA-binding transcriptional ArsR family regulator